MTSTTTLRDKLWVGKMTIEKPNLIHELSDLVKEFEAVCVQEKKKYNKFSEFSVGAPVFPNFPFKVKVAIGFSKVGPGGFDVYDIDPVPRPWILHIVEDPAKEASIVESTSFGISNLRHIMEVPIEGWDQNVTRYATYREARESLLKIASYIYRVQREDHESGNVYPRYAQCPACLSMYSWSGQSVRGFEGKEHYIKLHPLRKVDEIIVHEDCKAKAEK